MSRIGKKLVSIPAGVTVQVTGADVTIKGPKGENKVQVLPGIVVTVQDQAVAVTRTNEERQTRAFHGLIRSLVNNGVIGSAQGYKKTLKLVGTGYRVAMKGSAISLSLGFSHPVDVKPENGIKLSIEGNDTIHIEGVDKHAVGQMAANIRSIRPPEPYKGKGVRYIDEVVKRKAGKTATK